MLHLLYIEWLKIKNYRTFWVIFLLFLVSIIGINYVSYEMVQDFFDNRVKKKPSDAIIKMLIGTPPYAYPQVWQMVSQVSSYLLIIPGLLTIILFTNEFSYKTHRQNIIDGFTRKQFITSKILLVVIFAILTTLMAGITAMIFGYVSGSSFTTEKIHSLAILFLESLNYMLFALLVAVLFRRSGISIGVYFLYVVIFDNVLFWILYRYGGKSGFYLPVDSADNLMMMPVFGELQKQIERPAFEYILAACIAWVLLYVYFSYRRFGKSDL